MPFDRNRPRPRRRIQQQPKPAPKPKAPPPPPAPPKEPVSGKMRRQMLKAAAWRLARIVRTRPSSIFKLDAQQLEQAASQAVVPFSPGEARRLAAKIIRLRKAEAQG